MFNGINVETKMKKTTLTFTALAVSAVLSSAAFAKDLKSGD